MGGAIDSVDRRASHCGATGCTDRDLVATPLAHGEKSIYIQRKTAINCMAMKSTKKVESIKTGADNVDGSVVDGRVS